MDVTVVVGTYGEPRWVQLAHERAIPSAQAPVIHRHGRDLANARNEGLALVETEWVCFLDADDELEPGFFDAAAEVGGDLRPPCVRYDGGGAAMPRVVGHHHLCAAHCLDEGNWMVVGTVARAELLREVGGWPDYLIWEDWALWRAAWKAGAEITPAYEAVYRAHTAERSRNNLLSRPARRRVHRQILAA